MIESLSIGTEQLHETANFSIVSFKIGKPAPRAAAGTVPTGHGTYDVTSFYGPRVYEVVGEVWGSDNSDFWQAYDRLITALVLDGLKTMTFRRVGRTFDEQALVRIDGELDSLLENPSPFTRFGFSLVSPDPRIYSAVQKTGIFDPTLAGGSGLTFPLAFELGFGDDVSPFSVINEGNISTPAVFTVEGPATNFSILNDTTGERIVTTADLELGESLVIDTSSRTAKLNGETDRADLIDSSQTTWFELVKGTNVLRLNGSGFSEGETSLNVNFRDARMG
jgi:hypothetical protein